MLNALPGVVAKHLDILISHPKPNSFILTEDTPKVWLLPRYRARINETVEQMIDMEKEVERVYRAVDPEAIIHWIDSDVMYENLGAIHCVAMTVPRTGSLLGSSKNLESLKSDE